ncbi:MAG: hypothetical protein ACE5JK_06330, partial [Candidatus Omnitrophota bacterium]
MATFDIQGFLQKIYLRIVLLMAIVAIAIMWAAFDHYLRAPGKTAQIITLGLFIGIVVTVFLVHLDHTLRTETGIKYYAKMPFIGEIPPALKEDANKRIIDKIVDVKPEAPMSETFRNIRVNYIFSAALESAPPEVIMVGSSLFAEGKSFVASNLAITFARAKEPTLLIDADMRRGELGDFFKVGTGKGLSNYLFGKASFDESLASTDIRNLTLLPSGPHVEDPSELLKSEKLSELMKKARPKFKRIIVNIPAIL